MLKQSLKLKQMQKLSPQQIQFIKLLQVPTAALEQRIKEELEENPALEENRDELDDSYDDEDAPEEKEEDDFDLSDYLEEDDVADYRMSDGNGRLDEDDEYSRPIAMGTSFHEKLIQQLGLLKLTEKEARVALQIIGSFDQDGYLRRPIENLVDDLAFAQNVSTDEKEVERLLLMIQEFDPAGIGARDLRECLLIQLKRRKRNVAINLAIDIIRDHFDAFTKKHYERLGKILEADDDLLREAQHEILKCNPRPGNTAADEAGVTNIIPDFIIHNVEGELELKLNARNAPELKISREYKEMLDHYSKAAKKDSKAKDTLVFVKSKLDAAKWFVDAVKQRQHTLLTTMEAILNHQYDFFLTGDETKLKPMILKDIADVISMDISTVSRVANSKYVATEFGTFPLKNFFSEGIMTDAGEEVSSKEVKKILSECIEQEDKRKPISDDRLAEILNEKGYNIARRTVAKYREQLNIPVARLRKEL